VGARRLVGSRRGAVMGAHGRELAGRHPHRGGAARAPPVMKHGHLRTPRPLGFGAEQTGEAMRALGGSGSAGSRSCFQKGTRACRSSSAGLPLRTRSSSGTHPPMRCRFARKAPVRHGWGAALCLCNSSRPDRRWGSRVPYVLVVPSGPDHAELYSAWAIAPSRCVSPATATSGVAIS
jgi:hypothetical protein